MVPPKMITIDKTTGPGVIWIDDLTLRLSPQASLDYVTLTMNTSHHRDYREKDCILAHCLRVQSTVVSKAW